MPAPPAPEPSRPRPAAPAGGEIAGSTLTFSRRPLDQALRGLAEMGFAAVELGALEGWAHVSPRALAARPREVTAAVAGALDAAGLRAVALNAGFGAAPASDQPALAEALAALAARLGARVLTIPAAPPPREDILARAAAEIRRLQALVGVCARHGVALAVEGHMGALTEDPAAAAGLCRAVPGLRLTLDPSHYWAGPAQGRGWEAVLPHVAQVHLRDAGTGGWPEIQVAPGRGRVDFPRVLAALAAAGYAGAYSVEYIDTLPVAGGGTAAEAALQMRRLVAPGRPG